MSRFLIFKRFKNYKEYYNTLGLDYNSTTKEIKDRFLRLSKIYHPDNKVTGNHLRFLKIKEAFDAIKDNPRVAQQDTQDSFNTNSYIYKHDETRRPPTFRREPLSMEHIQRVYQSMNREPEVEQPKYRPGEDHNYPNTDFNRFEFARRWDPISKQWIYKKRATASQYEQKMKKNYSILNLCLTIAMLGALLNGLNYNIFMKNITTQSVRSVDDIAKDKTGVFVIRDGK